MEIDECLFAAFCPQQLKNALANAAELELPAVPTIRGLDVGPVLRLCATFAMIGFMGATAIAPQAHDVYAAGDAICGTPRVCRAVTGAYRIRTGYTWWCGRRLTELGIRGWQGQLSALG